MNREDSGVDPKSGPRDPPRSAGDIQHMGEKMPGFRETSSKRRWATRSVPQLKEPMAALPTSNAAER